MFNKTIYYITQNLPNPPHYLHFVGWVYLWAAIFHWITAILNCRLSSLLSHAVSKLKYRVQFPEIRDPILVRHIRVLRLLCIPPIRNPNHNAPILLHHFQWRRTCWYHTIPPHARHFYSLPISLYLPLFPSPHPTVLCRLRDAPCSHNLFGMRLLGPL